MSTTSTALMTAEELMQLPDDDLRHELINGELITMPLPKLPHGRAANHLGVPLANFVLENDLGEVYIGDIGYQVTWKPDTVLAPDVTFVSKQRLEEAGDVEGYWQGPPDLAVEVYSPAYRPGRVSTRTVAVYRSESDITTFSGSDYLESPDLFPGFRLSLDRIFGVKANR
jgi:Uma2 family endonuclease